MARGGVTFELERFGWTGGGALLEVGGRWRGSRSRRLGPARLAAGVGGRRRLASSLLVNEVDVDPEPLLWRTEFPWEGDASGPFELEVGSSLIIALPEPEGLPAGGLSTAAADPVRERLDAAQRQIAAEQGESERLRDELVALRRDTFDVEQTRKFLALAQATADAERKAVRAAREQAAERRATETAALPDPSQSMAVLLRRENERLQDALASAVAAGDRAREELLEARSRAGAAVDERSEALETLDAARLEADERRNSLEQERDAARREADELRASLEQERDAALRETSELRATLSQEREAARLAANEPTARAERAQDAADEADPTEAREPVARSHGPSDPGWVDPVTQAGPAVRAPEETETWVLDGPGARAAGHRSRPRVTVIPQRTASAPRRYAERPPKDSPALRAIAGVLLLLLVIVLVAMLVIVA